MPTDSPLALIRALNDRFRQSGFGAGRIFISPGIKALPLAERRAIFDKVRAFDAFPADDPLDAHDCGSFVHDGLRVLWRITCFAPGFAAASANPADAERTVRVLSVMLARETF